MEFVFCCSIGSWIPRRYSTKFILEKFWLWFMFWGVCCLPQQTRLRNTNLKMRANRLQLGHTVSIFWHRQEPWSIEFMVWSEQPPPIFPLWPILRSAWFYYWFYSRFYSWFCSPPITSFSKPVYWFLQQQSQIPYISSSCLQKDPSQFVLPPFLKSN